MTSFVGKMTANGARGAGTRANAAAKAANETSPSQVFGLEDAGFKTSDRRVPRAGAEDADVALTQPVVALAPLDAYTFASKPPVRILPNLAHKQFLTMLTQRASSTPADGTTDESQAVAADDDTQDTQRPTFVPGFTPDDLTIDVSILRSHFGERGIRLSVEACIVVHSHGHPHVLILQSPSGLFRLPGAVLDPDEDEVVGLTRRLQALFMQPTITTVDDQSDSWFIGPLLAVWWRPNFEGHLYPYIPAHVTNPKEMRKIFFVQAKTGTTFHVPSNYKLLAVPLFDVYDNSKRYGNIISSLPETLSRFFFQYLDE